MLFNSYQFLLFFPLVVIVYYLIPIRIRYVWLLFASYYFYMCWNTKYALLLLASTGITYFSGLMLSCWKRKSIVVISVCLNLGILFFFKYFDFFIENVNQILWHLNMEILTPEFDVLLPVGISFYIFQALSYTIDIYRGEVEVEKNFLKYTLFVSFFPQLVAGPIERSKNLLKQMSEEHPFRYENLCEGLLIMLWGYFLKLVIADRIAIFVDHAYSTETLYDGKYLIVASVLFAFQIYCDFYGYSSIAIGAAKVMGFQLMENFECPYFSKSVAEFWRRWHISLSSWFRDYLYIPLGGNRKGKIRTYLNVMIVFIVSGLWHGANWSFAVWGGINGLCQVIGGILRPLWKTMGRIKLLTPLYILVTFAFVDFSWIFFRADNMNHAVDILDRMIHFNNVELLENGRLYDLGLNEKNFVVLLLALFVLLIADVCKYKKWLMHQKIMSLRTIPRWGICLAGIAVVLIFGIWGSGYQETNFIYFQF